MRLSLFTFFSTALFAVGTSSSAGNSRFEQLSQGFAYAYLAEDYCSDLKSMSEATLSNFIQMIVDGSYHDQYDIGYERFLSEYKENAEQACKEARFIRKNVLGW